MLVWVQKAPHVAKKEQGKPLETSLTREYRASGPERSYLSQGRRRRRSLKEDLMKGLRPREEGPSNF